jgi:hypothetical protein
MHEPAEEKQGCFKRLMNRNKVSSADSEIDLGNEKEILARKELKEMERSEFEQKLEMYKFYLAGNFFVDNIGSVEIETEEKELIRTSF